MAWGDRPDGKLIKDVDYFKSSYANLLPTRIESQTYFSFPIEIDNVLRYVHSKNEQLGEKRYKVFYVMLAALVRMLSIRTQLNRFISNSNTYERDAVYISFAIKRSLSDENSDETIAKLRFEYGETIDSIAEKLLAYINKARKVDKEDDKLIKQIDKLPSFIKRLFWNFVRFLDKRGLLPKSLVDIDPLHSSIMVANMGSIGMSSNFHHLYEFGTISMFACIGKIRKAITISKYGEQKINNVIDFSVTIDERLADGLYYLNSIKMFDEWLKNPETLEQPYKYEKQVTS